MRSKNSSPSNGEANYSPNRENKEDEEEFIQLRPIVTPETKKGDDESKTTKRESNNGRTKSRKENKSEKLQDDMKLPMYPFKPAEGITGASPVNRASSPEEPERDVTTPSDEPVYDPYGRKYIKPIDPEEKYRTDINSKAKFLETTPGKFRREFSADHPLVKGGTGKYSTELENGMQPVGMSIEPLEKEGLKTESMEDTLKTASKIERLTFAAETSVADPQAMLEQLKKIQNERLLKVLEEERKAEEDRSRMIKKVADEQERAQLESVFAEERKKASERILSVTREHETAMKDAVLGMMNLGIAKKKKSAR